MLNFANPRYLEERFDTFRRLRDDAPVVQVALGPIQSWVLTRYDDVQAFLRDPTIQVRDPAESVVARLGGGAAARTHRVKMSVQDPPTHSRLRVLVGKAFMPGAIAKLRNQVEAIVEALLDDFAGRDEVDLVADFGAKLPARLICAIAGLPVDDWQRLIARTDDFMPMLAPFPLSPDQQVRADAVCQFYFDYFGEQIDRLRAEPPRDDMMGALIAAEEGGEKLGRDELCSFLESFVNAGYETTTSAITTGVLALERHPDQKAALSADPELAKSAVDEVLRWDAPVQFLVRYPVAPKSFHGVEIGAGEMVMLALASANRDERRFADPDGIDLARDDNKHLSFGGGRHHCLGNQLAKLEAEIALARLYARFPDLEVIDTDPPRRANPMFPAIDRLRVRLNA